MNPWFCGLTIRIHRVEECGPPGGLRSWCTQQRVPNFVTSMYLENGQQQSCIQFIKYSRCEFSIFPDQSVLSFRSSAQLLHGYVSPAYVALYPPSSGIRIVLLDIRGCRRNVSRSAVASPHIWKRLPTDAASRHIHCQPFVDCLSCLVPAVTSWRLSSAITQWSLQPLCRLDRYKNFDWLLWLTEQNWGLIYKICYGNLMIILR